MPYATHTVENQPPELYPYDPYALDQVLHDVVTQIAGEWGHARCCALSRIAGSRVAAEHAARAERNEPYLETHDRFGSRIDHIELDPSWYWLLDQGYQHGLHALPWQTNQPGAHTVRASLAYLWAQLDMGVMTPLSTTLSALDLVAGQPAVAARWYERLVSDSSARGALAGITTTEKQGGTDLWRNSTHAEDIGDDTFLLTGHKWFCSYPPCDVFITLARTEAGLSCFLFESGDPGFRVQRLKRKLGTRSLPSAEIEFDGVQAHLIGHSGDGLQMIMSMINLGRFECVMAAAALMRVALVQAIHHTRHRHVLGKRLCDQPLMESVLADLALESEAATTLMLRIAQAFDDKHHALARLLTALAKFWVCKRAPAQINEALECLGGNGYVEEALLARYYRDAPLNAIWEGPGNVAALDVVRCLKRDPNIGDAFMAQSRAVRGVDRTLDQAFDHIHFAISAIQSGDAPPMQPRLLAERMTVAYQAALLIQLAPPYVHDSFLRTRLGTMRGLLFGHVSPGQTARRIIERTFPQ